MNSRKMIALSALAALTLSGAALAQEHEHGGGEHQAQRQAPHQAARQAEPHQGPQGYQRVAEPQGWNARPSTVDRGAYHHNYQAARSYRVGPYHYPRGWVPHRWVYGEFLPRGYWAPQYILADYWLFGLEVPPGGYEWVRVGSDAVLVSLTNGEVLQVEYGVFG